MNDAQYAVETYFQRAAEWSGTKFKASPRAKIERDPTLRGVTFYRYPDGSVIRKDPDGDLQPS